MTTPSTGFASTLRILYKNYGGWRALLFSEYFIFSLLISAFSWPLIESEGWIDLAKTISPTLAGFSIAAYAIIFAVLDEKTRNALRRPSDKMGGNSPLLIIVSAVAHAVIVQILSILWAVIMGSHSLPAIGGPEIINASIKNILSALGLVLTLYGFVLVIASVLSTFRLLEITSRR